ncbi:type II toxin-antitoxin system VapB family antitoxin [Microbacterium sp.]|uniref:type II toxin-antitoxin system VapB family antitoxin n=1 Tax=Microbacterium sp. TaxID=51671 RepID=UPI0039E2BB64
MSLNIKNEDVHAAVRELASALGVSQTSAVEVAVRAKLAELAEDSQRLERRRRIDDAIRAAQEAFRGVDLWAIADDLYDEMGLPK